MITMVPGELVVPAMGWLQSQPASRRYVVGLVISVRGQALEVLFTIEDGGAEVRPIWRSLVERVK